MDPRQLKCLDEWEISRLAHHYAEAVDRRDDVAFVSLFTPDGVLEGPGWRREGHAAIATTMSFLNENYVATWHGVLTQTIHIDGDRAHGQTYCSARHRQKGGYLENQIMTMTIRYQDSFVRTDSGWKIDRRKLVIDWIESTTAQFGLRE